MNIISKLTLRHLMLNKKRTLVTIVGVIISVAMIASISTFSISFLNFLRNNEIGNVGNWHALYKDAGIESVQEIRGDENIDTISISKDIGYSYLEDSKNPNKPYLFIKAYDEVGFKNFNINILEGRLPRKSNEIVISQHIKENAGVDYKIGEKLYLDIGNRLELSEDMSILDQRSSYIPTNQDGNGEQLNLVTKDEYVITGIISRPSIEPHSAPGYTVISYIENKELAKYENLNLFVTFKKVNSKLYAHAEELGINAGVDDITYNNMLLRYYGITHDDNFLVTFYGFIGIMIFIVMVGSIALIYNAFAISISERSRHLGMLASIGATKKQKRYSVFFEGLVVGIIGIPVGILFGTLGIGATFIFIQPLLEKIINGSQRLTLVISPISILVAVILSSITIFISCYIPAKLASKISPIDAVRQTQDIKLSSKVVRTSKLTRSIFGFEAELALKNLKRNSRRYRATIFSLVISIVLFLSVSSFILLSQKSTEVLQHSTISYDVGVTLTPSLTGEERDILYRDITSLENINEYKITETMRVEFLLDENMVPDNIKDIIQPTGDKYQFTVDVRSIDDEALIKYTKDIGVDISKFKGTGYPAGILINTVNVMVDNKIMTAEHFKLTEGDRINIIPIVDDILSQDLETAIEIIKLTDTSDLGETRFYNPENALMYVSKHTFESLMDKFEGRETNSFANIIFKSDNPGKLVEDINQYKSSLKDVSLTIKDYSKDKAEQAMFNTLVLIFVYGFILLITAICVANIFNTISTSISMRRREFAMLRSMGMTPKGFNKMINYESLLYGIKGLSYGIPISFILMYFMYIVLSQSFVFPFVVPWGSIVIVVIGVFGIVSLTMLYSSSKIKKENIIDALKMKIYEIVKGKCQ